MPINRSDKLVEFISQTDLNNSFIVGYYGGGNFGDELLLEILLNLFKKYDYVSNVYVYYLNEDWYQEFHKKFGVQLIPGGRFFKTLAAIFKSKNIIVGGGGLWGLDFNPKAFQLSCALFFSRILLRKKVYLLGVGYYSSTNRFGHLGAKLAARYAQKIFARDQESYLNFRNISQNVIQATDFSSNIGLLDQEEYAKETSIVRSVIDSTETKTLLITVREFKPPIDDHYKNLIKEVVKNNKDKRIVLLLLESRIINPNGYKFISKLSKLGNKITYSDYHFNPVGFYLFFHNNRNFIFIAPHYHALVIALKNSIDFLPIVYDNKSAQLLSENGCKEYTWIDKLTPNQVQNFIDERWA